MGSWPPAPDPLSLGGGRFRLTRRGGHPPVIVKQGDPAALAVEAEALRALGEWRGVPRLLESAGDTLTTVDVGGTPRPLQAIRAPELRELGTLLRELHDLAVPHPATPWTYRTARLTAIRARPAGRAVARRPAPAPAPRLCRIHGDLIAENVVWTPGPVLVDWEFSRIGDPAEDLAYLLAVNGAGPDARRALMGGYRDDGIAHRVRRWAPHLAAEAIDWWLMCGEVERARSLAASVGISLPSDPSGPPRPSDGAAPAGDRPR
ncbi:MAG: aminoglycoside phosphotransferase family protein [Thermoleophilia bacterium]